MAPPFGGGPGSLIFTVESEMRLMKRETRVFLAASLGGGIPDAAFSASLPASRTVSRFGSWVCVKECSEVFSKSCSDSREESTLPLVGVGVRGILTSIIKVLAVIALGSVVPTQR